MSEESEAQWRDFYNWIEERSGSQGDLRAIRDFASKAAEHAARIAGVLTIVADERASAIPAEIMTAAVRLTTWYTDEALRLQQACRTDPALLRAQALLDWLSGREEMDVKFSDVLRLGPAPTRTKKEADAAVRILIEHNLVEEISERPRLVRVVSGGVQA